eukprot:jgi/Chrzof1/6351/Cz18g05100.t1
MMTIWQTLLRKTATHTRPQDTAEYRDRGLLKAKAVGGMPTNRGSRLRSSAADRHADTPKFMHGAFAQQEVIKRTAAVQMAMLIGQQWPSDPCGVDVLAPRSLGV